MATDISALFGPLRHGDRTQLYELWRAHLGDGEGAVEAERFRQWTQGDGAPRTADAIQALATALTERGRPTTADEITELIKRGRKQTQAERLAVIEEALISHGMLSREGAWLVPVDPSPGEEHTPTDRLRRPPVVGVDGVGDGDESKVERSS